MRIVKCALILITLSFLSITASGKELERDGIEILLAKHTKDVGKQTIRWWLTFEDGSDVPRVAQFNPNHPRFFIPSEKITFYNEDNPELPLYGTVSLQVHALKPHSIVKNSVTYRPDRHPLHYCFTINFVLREYDMDFSTTPIRGIPLVSDAKYEPFEDDSDAYIQVDLRSFLHMQLLLTPTL